MAAIIPADRADVRASRPRPRAPRPCARRRARATARSASRTALAIPSGVELPWATTATPRRPSRIAPADRVRVHLAAQPAEGRAQQQAAGGRDGPGPRRVADGAGDGARGPLERLQRDVAGEAVGDDDVGGVRSAGRGPRRSRRSRSPSGLGQRARRGPRPRRGGPSSAPRRRSAAPTRGRSTPRTLPANAAPRWANWIRCCGRASVLAPQSRKRTVVPSLEGTGIWAASAGRWTPLIRFIANSAAVIAAPVEPALTRRGRASRRRRRRRP